MADEINRAPAKVQSALLEAMQERQVTIRDTTFKLDDPFLVLATQNPIEQEGTYPLPEAQIDRFMMKIKVDYPSAEEEKEIVKRIRAGAENTCQPVSWSVSALKSARETLHEIHMEDRIVDYIVRLTQATRKPEEFGLDIGSHGQLRGIPTGIHLAGSRRQGPGFFERAGLCDAPGRQNHGAGSIQAPHHFEL